MKELNSHELPILPNSSSGSSVEHDENWLIQRVKELEDILSKERQIVQELRTEIQHNLPSPESLDSSPLTKFEQKTLNHCIMEYLRENYRLTAVAFKQQITDDDTDDWSALSQLYGIPNYKPPPLKCLHRYFIGGGVNAAEFGLRDALEKSKKENEELQEKYKLLEEKFTESQGQIDELLVCSWTTEIDMNKNY